MRANNHRIEHLKLYIIIRIGKSHYYDTQCNVLLLLLSLLLSISRSFSLSRPLCASACMCVCEYLLRHIQNGYGFKLMAWN